MKTRSVLDEQELPPIESFSSSLGVGSHISIDDYRHAKSVWNTFGCSTMRDYINIYCQLDVLLLAELFSQFKDNCKRVNAYILKTLLLFPIISNFTCTQSPILRCQALHTMHVCTCCRKRMSG